MATFTNQSKNNSTFKKFFRHGKEPRVEELADFVFTDVIFEDGTQLKDVTFAQLQDIIWANQSKNSSSFSLQEKSDVSITWDEAEFTWDEATGTWDYPRTVFVNQTKNTNNWNLQAKN